MQPLSGSSRYAVTIRGVVTGLVLMGLVCSGLGLIRVLRWTGELALYPDRRRWLLLGLAVTCLTCCGLGLVRLLNRRNFQPEAVDLRVAFVLLVLGSLLFTLIWESYSYSRALLWLGGLGALYSVWLLSRSTRPARLQSKGSRVLDLLLFNLALTLFSLQLVLQAAARVFPGSLLSIPQQSRELLEQSRCRPGTLRFGFPCNSLGYYDEEPESGSGGRIALVGDSFALGIVPHPRLFTTVAERLTGLRIDTFGVARAGPPEYRLILRDHALQGHPDLLLLSIFIGNDIQHSHLSRGRHQGQFWLRFWLDRNHHILWRLAPRLRRFAAEVGSGRELRTLGHAGGTEANNTPGPTGAEQYPWIGDYRLEEPTYSWNTYLESERRYALAICQPQQQDVFASFFEDMEALLTSAGDTPVAVILFPSEFQVEESLWNALRSGIEGDLLRDLPQQALLSWLQARQIPALDLLPTLRSVPPLEDGSRHLYHLQNGHLNTRGNQVAGEALARFLLELSS